MLQQKNAMQTLNQHELEAQDRATQKQHYAALSGNYSDLRN